MEVSDNIHTYQKGNNKMEKKRNKELEVIALYLENYAGRFYLRQISKLANLPLKTCQNVVGVLEKEKIVKSKVEGKNKYFSLNLDNIQTKSYLLQAEIYTADKFLKKHPSFKTFLKSVHTSASLIVFGSYAKSTAGKDSDIDMLVLSDKKQDLPFHLLPYETHLLTMEEETFKNVLEKKEGIAKEIEENHVILNNPSYYVNLLWEHYGK